MHVRSFSCKRDHLTIRGREYRPEGSRLPVVIISHGFMANQGTVKKYAKAIAQMGYAAFTFDFNGGGLWSKSDGKTEEMSVLTEKADLESVISYVKTLPYTDSGRIVLMGCSQGGFVSALTAAGMQKEILALILFYPALCIPDDTRKGQMMFARFDPENIPEQMKCGPMMLGRCYAESVIGMDAIEETAKYDGPVLLLHGTEDFIVNVSYARRAAEAYPHGTYREIPGAGHGFRKKEDMTALAEVERFLGKVF